MARSAGRPALPPEQRRAKIVQILCTLPERERLKSAAAAAGYKSVSRWALDVLTREAGTIEGDE